MAVVMKRWFVVTAFVLFVTACGHDSAHVSQSSSSAPAPSTTATTAPPAKYQVKRGDTLGAIARQFGVSIDAIVAANHLTSQDQLAQGQVLVIPPPAAVQLVASPADGQPGATIQLKLTGARSSETVTFEVDGPGGKKFSGPPHTPAADGTVTATYQTTPQDPAGMYHVGATGSGGTTAQASFTLTPAPPASIPN
jgi:LysM repeat protein